jgi:hypothetical protein
MLAFAQSTDFTFAVRNAQQVDPEVSAAGAG